MSAVREWAASQNTELHEVIILKPPSIAGQYIYCVFFANQQEAHELDIFFITKNWYLLAGCSSKQLGKVENSNTDDCTNNPSGNKRSQVQQPITFDVAHTMPSSIMCTKLLYLVSFIQLILQPSRARLHSRIWCGITVFFCWSCSVVAGCVHEENMDGLA